jgi:isoleucyl-tRNA synthetase
MPYAQNHYPFENVEAFEAGFPANFIAEGLDQTRGWFYTLMVLATALFDDVPFQNCVVNGLILAEDGRKMSKSLKNYPDPTEVLDASGADALRAFLINSPVVRADPLRFTADGVREVVRTVMLPYWNAYSFFTTYAEADAITTDDLASAPPPPERPEIDRWILSVLQSLTRDVNREMEGYYLYNVIPPMLHFIDDLTNWYIRRSRRRFWRRRENATETDKLAAFATLHEVLVTFAKVVAPVLPFITEDMYQELVVNHRDSGPASVHHEDYPAADGGLIDPSLEAAMAAVRTTVGLGRSLRVANNLRVRQPLPSLTVVSRDATVRKAIESHRDLIGEELNVKTVAASADESPLVDLSARADFKTLGPRLGRGVKEVAAAIAGLTSDEIHRLLDGGTIEAAGVALSSGDIVVSRTPKPGFVVATESDISVALDCSTTPELVVEGLAREVVNRVQGMRRDAGFEVTDRIRLAWSTADEELQAAFARFSGYIADEVLAAEMTENQAASTAVDITGRHLKLEIEKV